MPASLPKSEPTGPRHFPFSFSNGGYFPSFEAESRFQDHCSRTPGLKLACLSTTEGVSAVWSTGYRAWDRTSDLALGMIRFWNAVFARSSYFEVRSHGTLLPIREIAGDVHCRVVPKAVSGAQQEWQFLAVDDELRVTARIDRIIVSTESGQRDEAEYTALADEVEAARALHAAIAEVIPDLAVVDARTVRRNLALFRALLSPIELGYFRRYIPERSRIEFCGGRVLAKSLVAAALGVPAFALSSIEVRRGALCEPVVYLAGDPVPDCCVSISHKDRFILCALSRSGPVGVDVEHVSRNLRTLEAQFLSDRERDCLTDAHFEGQAYDAALARIWTAKEAIVKLRRSTYGDMLVNAELLSLGTASSNYVLRDSGEKVRIEHRSHGEYMFSVAMRAHD